MAWVINNTYLGQSDMEKNAAEFWAYMKTHNTSMTVLAAAAMLGNIQTESTINPGLWESMDEGNLNVGFGLTQWTPASKYINWAGDNWYSGERECDRLLYESENNLQWFANPNAGEIGIPVNPPVTFYEFLTATDLMFDKMIRYFLAYYEHPASLTATVNDRVNQAYNWYEFISKQPVPGWIPVAVKIVNGGARNGNIRKRRVVRH